MIMDANDLQNYLFSKGLLHDCHISSIRHDGISHLVNMDLQDVNASFLGLPEYPGTLPCRISFIGASFAPPYAQQTDMRIFEAEVSSPGDGDSRSSAMITFWPEGHIKVFFEVACVVEGALSS